MKWELLGSRELYRGFFKLRRLSLRHERFAGGEFMAVERELLDRGHAAAVLPFDPRTNRLLLVEQFRVGALDSPRGPWLMEIIAGMIGPGETAEEVARREAWEEAHCQLHEMLHIHDYYSSPGGTSERISLFMARADLSAGGGIHGLEDEGEDIRAHALDLDQAFAWLDEQGIDNAMAIIALQWLRLNHGMLRDRWSSGAESTP